MLFFAIHKIEVENATVPLSMIVLMDFVQRETLPADLKCRAMMPSGGSNISVWDASSKEALQSWLDGTLAEYEPGLVSTCHEVQEEFSFGLSLDLAHQRTADKVTAGSRSARDNMWKQVEAFDQKTHLLTAAGQAFVNMKTRTNQAMESEKVANAMTTINEKITTANTALSWFGSKVRDSFVRASSGATSQDATAAKAQTDPTFPAASRPPVDGQPSDHIPMSAEAPPPPVTRSDEARDAAEALLPGAGMPAGGERPAGAVPYDAQPPSFV